MRLPLIKILLIVIRIKIVLDEMKTTYIYIVLSQLAQELYCLFWLRKTKHSTQEQLKKTTKQIANIFICIKKYIVWVETWDFICSEFRLNNKLSSYLCYETNRTNSNSLSEHIFNAILFEIQNFSFRKMHLKISFANWRPLCLVIVA